MYKSKIMETIHGTMKDFHKAGAVDEKTMRKFDALCLPKVKEYTPAQIVRLRKKSRTSQAVFACYLNTTATTIQNWEQGQKKPGRMALKLLSLVELHGIELLGASEPCFQVGQAGG